MSTHNFAEEVASIFQSLLGLDPPEPDVDLVGTGLLDSLTIVTLITELEACYDVRIPLEQIDLESIRTIRRLQALIEGASRQSDPASTVLRLLRPGTGRPVFLLHTSWASAQTAAPLARVLATQRPIYAFQASYLQSSTPPPAELEPMAAAYVREVRAVQPHGPYALAGYSFGGLIAYAMAVELSRAGESVDLLGMIDVVADPAWLSAPTRLAFRLELLRHRCRGVLEHPVVKGLAFTRKVRARIGQTRNAGLPERSDVPEKILRLVRIADVMEARYRPPLYTGNAVLLVADERSPWRVDLHKFWKNRVTGTLRMTTFPGGHTNLQPEAWHAIGAVLSPLLNEPA